MFNDIQYRNECKEYAIFFFTNCNFKAKYGINPFSLFCSIENDIKIQKSAEFDHWRALD